MYRCRGAVSAIAVVAPAPPNADALIATAGTGQYDIDYFGFPMGMGMPVVDDSYWDVGIIATGSEGPVEYSMGVTAGTPGWGSTVKDENSGKTIMGRIGLAATFDPSSGWTMLSRSSAAAS